MRLLRAVTFWLALLLIVRPASAVADPAIARRDNLSGRVSDAQHRPIAGARVRIDALNRAVRTDAQGQFRFADLAPGRYLVSVAALGFAPATAPATVPSSAGLDFTLAPSAAVLTPIVVTASAEPTDASSSPLPTATLDGRDLRREQSVSVARAIEQLPGVRSLSTGAQIAKPVIRGLTGDRVLVLDGGHRLSDYSWSDEDGPSLDARFADRIEVVRGPLSLLYGSEALGGVVNAITAPLPEVDASGRSFHDWIAELSVASNNAESGTLLGYSGARGAVGYRINGIFRRAAALHTPDGELDNTGFTVFNGDAAIGFRGNGGSLTFRFVHQGGEFQLLEANGPADLRREEDDGPVRKSDDERFQVDALHAAGGWQLGAHAQYQVHSLIEVSDDANAGSGVETTAFDLLLNTATLKLTAARQFSDGLVLTLGADGTHQTNDTRGPIPLVPGATITGGAGYAVVESRHDRWSLLLGGRVDASKIAADPNAILLGSTNPGTGGPVAVGYLPRNFSAATGNIGIVLRPVTGVTLAGSVGHAWRAPNLFELYANGPELSDARYIKGDPTLATEQGTSVDASLRVQYKRVRGELSGFVNTIDHYTFFAPTGQVLSLLPVYLYQQANARLLGGEASLELDATSALTLHGRVDGVRSENTDTDQPLPLTPPLRAVFGFDLHGSTGFARNAHVGADLVGVARQNRLASVDTPTDGYALLELQAGLNREVAGRGLGVELLVHNATNTSYRDFLSRYKLFALNPGIDVALRVSLAF